MNEIRLCADEKAVLRFLYENRQGDIELFENLTPARRSAAARSLKANGFLNAVFEEGGNVISARLTNTGVAYMENNPGLDDPLSVEIERLQKENLVLQNNELEYKATIRRQEDTIRLWHYISAIAGIVGLLGGWLVFFLEII